MHHNLICFSDIEWIKENTGTFTIILYVSVTPEQGKEGMVTDNISQICVCWTALEQVKENMDTSTLISRENVDTNVGTLPFTCELEAHFSCNHV